MQLIRLTYEFDICIPDGVDWQEVDIVLPKPHELDVAIPNGEEVGGWVDYVRYTNSELMEVENE